MNQRIKHSDRKNALSILLAAEREMNYTLKLQITDESAFNIINNKKCYWIFFKFIDHSVHFNNFRSCSYHYHYFKHYSLLL